MKAEESGRRTYGVGSSYVVLQRLLFLLGFAIRPCTPKIVVLLSLISDTSRDNPDQEHCVPEPRRGEVHILLQPRCLLDLLAG